MWKHLRTCVRHATPLSINIVRMLSDISDSLASNIRLSFSEPKCATGDPILYPESIFEHHSHNSKS